MKQYFGIDIGGTAVKLGIVDETGRVLLKGEESVSFDGYQTPVLTTVRRAAKEFLTTNAIPVESLVLIVTNKPKEIADAIYAVSQHGATILDGEGSYEHCERQIVYSVVSAAQTKKVIHAVKEADPKAFINEVKTQKLSGRFYLPKES